MSDPANLTMLFEYNAWADNVLFDAMRALPADVLSKQTGTLFKSMIGTLNHNYQVDLIWRAHMLGQQHGFTSRRDLIHADFNAIVAAQREINGWWSDWCRKQPANVLDEVVDFKFVSGNPGRLRRRDMLQHIVIHKTYHRGWIAEMFFENGFVAPESDLSIYLIEAVPHHAAA